MKTKYAPGKVLRIKNEFHNTSVRVAVPKYVDEDLQSVLEYMRTFNESNFKRVKKILCGVRGCKCMGNWQVINLQKSTT